MTPFATPSVPTPRSERLYSDESPFWATVAWKQVLVLGGIAAAILGPVLLALALAA